MGQEKKAISKQFRIGQKTLDSIGVNPEHPQFRGIVEGMLIAFNECKNVTKKILATEFSHKELEEIYLKSSEVAQYANSMSKKNLFLVTLSDEEKNLPLAKKFNEEVNKITAVFVNTIISEAFRDGKTADEFARELKQLMPF
jgi:hypothetical protein